VSNSDRTEAGSEVQAAICGDLCYREAATTIHGATSGNRNSWHPVPNATWSYSSFSQIVDKLSLGLLDSLVLGVLEPRFDAKWRNGAVDEYAGAADAFAPKPGGGTTKVRGTSLLWAMLGLPFPEPCFDATWRRGAVGAYGAAAYP